MMKPSGKFQEVVDRDCMILLGDILLPFPFSFRIRFLFPLRSGGLKEFLSSLSEVEIWSVSNITRPSASTETKARCAGIPRCSKPETTSALGSWRVLG